MAELQDNLPPGWECKLDARSGKFYYINHFTKTTTWDDPRGRHKQMSTKHFTNMPVEHIPLQHGSPDVRRNYVYPSQTSPIPAFQMPAHHSPKSIPLQEMRSITRMSPLTVRGAKVQDSSLSVQTDTDEAVAKISSMFPTVSDTHIRLLLKKYHNREALVISALQVEKYPITTPGPFATPPPQRNIHHPSVYAPLHMTPPPGVRSCSRGGSPIFRPGSGSNSTHTGSPRTGEAYRSSPRPHSSPKLKLRYMKSVFPQAEETVILDILQNNENNIQKTSEILKDMGFEKKDTVKVAQQKKEAQVQIEKSEEERKAKQSTPPPKIKSAEEKIKLKEKLQQKYSEVADHLITIALESVHFDENKANQILQIMIDEDSEKSTETIVKVDEPDQSNEVESENVLQTLPVSQSRQSIKSILKCEKTEKDRQNFRRVIEENDTSYKSPYLTNTFGTNPKYTKGPNEKLLLEDYVKWQGANANLRKGSQSLAKGPNASLLSNRTYIPCGANSELRKGPKFGLAKGSIFSQLKAVVVGEPRGK